MKHLNALLSAAVAATFSFSAASAASVDLSTYVDANLSQYTNGNVYPANGGPITIGGVNFDLAQYPGGGTGVVQTHTNGLDDSFDIAVGQTGVTMVYTIINSSFGGAGSTIGTLTFNGSNGATYTNVRDHASTFFNTSAPNVYATDDFGSGDRLDVQQIILPAVFGSQTLTDIVFTWRNDIQLTPDSPVGGQGDPFLAAITTQVGAVPEPSTWAMMMLGFVGLGFMAYRRRLKPQGIAA